MALGVPGYLTVYDQTSQVWYPGMTKTHVWYPGTSEYKAYPTKHTLGRLDLLLYYTQAKLTLVASAGSPWPSAGSVAAALGFAASPPVPCPCLAGAAAPVSFASSPSHPQPPAHPSHRSPREVVKKERNIATEKHNSQELTSTFEGDSINHLQLRTSTIWRRINQPF